MDATAGNAQPEKMYNFQALGDSGVAAFVGKDRMHRGYVHVLSYLGHHHSRPDVASGRDDILMTPARHVGSGKGSY